MLFTYKYVDDLESTSGTIEASTVKHASVLITGDNSRYTTHGIKERHLDKIEGEKVIITGYTINSWSLEIVQKGSRKRKYNYFNA